MGFTHETGSPPPSGRNEPDAIRATGRGTSGVTEVACGAVFFFDGRKRPILGAKFFGPPFLSQQATKKKTRGKWNFALFFSSF